MGETLMTGLGATAVTGDPGQAGTAPALHPGSELPSSALLPERDRHGFQDHEVLYVPRPEGETVSADASCLIHPPLADCVRVPGTDPRSS